MRTSQLVFAFGFMVIFGGIQSPLAQVPARAAFEVASVKPNKSNTAPSTIRLAIQPGGRFTATNVTVRELIRVAYGALDPLDEARVIGGPGWTESDRFDIAAKAPTESGAQQLSLMLRSLLAEPFNLTLRRELVTIGSSADRPGAAGRTGPQ